MLAFFDLPQASSMAGAVDQLYDFIFWISLISFVGVIGAMTFFVWRYRRSQRDPLKNPYIDGHTKLELSVSAILFVLVMVIFAWGWIDYRKMLQAGEDPLEINILGRQWMWQTEYVNGRKLTNELVIPHGRSVSLIMSSADVIHSFFIPAFRLKQDVVPGAYTKLSMTATETGEFQVFCAEYCGTAHSSMLAKLRVLPPEEYERWQKIWELEQHLGNSDEGSAVSASLGGRGQKLFAEKGCTTCHSATGQKLVGPALNDLFGSEREFADGEKAPADENYIRESIMDPSKKVVQGFQPLMPTFRGQLTDDEVNALVGYIKELKK